VKPQLQALLIAEKVYVAMDGKKIIAGTFNHILFDPTPDPPEQVDEPGGEKLSIIKGGQHAGSPHAYISLTDVVNETVIHFQFVSLTKNKRLFGSALKIERANRLETIELILPLPNLHIREAGTYAFEVVWNGEILGSYRITAENIGSNPNNGGA